MNSTGHKYHSTILAFFKTLLEQLSLIKKYCISGYIEFSTPMNQS